jgi:hypothetical protein
MLLCLIFILIVGGASVASITVTSKKGDPNHDEVSLLLVMMPNTVTMAVALPIGMLVFVHVIRAHLASAATR